MTFVFIHAVHMAAQRVKHKHRQSSPPRRKPDARPDTRSEARLDTRPQAVPAKRRAALPPLVSHPQARARQLAAWVLEQVLFEQQALLNLWPRIDPETRERALVRSIVFASLRELEPLRALLQSRLSKPLGDDKRAQEARLLTALAELFFLSQSPQAMVVTSAVDAAPTPLKGLVNAVLRRALDAEADSRAILEKTPRLPDWLRKRWQEAYGAKTLSDILAALHGSAPLDLTFVTPVDETSAAQAPLAPWSQRFTETRNPLEIPAFRSGQAFVQDLAASLPVAMLPSLNGKRVLDLCAAPGGKTVQLLSAGAEVVALDRSAPRLAHLRDNLARMQFTTEVIEADALEYSDALGFDLVVLDAPCSATGTIRRHPDLPYVRKRERLLQFLPLQQRLLAKAFSLVRPGGQLLYAVCSLEVEEGERQIETFLSQTRDAKRARPLAPPPPGLEMTRTRAGFLRTLPSMRRSEGGMDGFFAAVLEKRQRDV